MASRRSTPPNPIRPLLLTGFEPFGGDTINASWEVARALHGQWVDGTPVIALPLPCVFGHAINALQHALTEHRPPLVLALGLASQRTALSVERVAINIDDARIADNRGAQPIDVPVIPGAPAAYFATLPIKAIVKALQDAGLPAEVSQTAGTFVCNHVFFALMHALRRRPAVRAGFMHVPALHGHGAMPLAEQIRGVRLALLTALQTQHDLQRSGGAIA